jgi:hypothetical protein
MGKGKVVRKSLRINGREERRWEDLEKDGWKKFIISTGDDVQRW